jgi:hypothetical protein
VTQADWANFFMVECRASAALIGLLFVLLVAGRDSAFYWLVPEPI